MISRVFGFVRDMIIAFFLGAGMETDAFFVAFKLPNFMRRLFAEGAFNSAFLPMFAGMLKKEGEARALRFASETFSYLLMTLIGVVIMAVAFMPDLMWFFAPGFAVGSEKYQLTIELTRITFPYLVFISLVCLLGGILNSFEKFAAVAAAPILLNVSMILAVVVLAPRLSPAYSLSWGVILAGIAQFLWLIWFCRRIQAMPLLLRPRLTPQVKRLLTLIAPAAIGAGVTQINSMVDMMLATMFEDAVSYLYYAERVYELPLAVIGIAVATALLPMLSKQIQAGEHDRAAHSTNQAIMLVVLFGLPSAGALITLSEPIVRVLFEHGKFNATDRDGVYPALTAFACGLPAFLLVKIFAASFFSAQDTKTPVKIAVAAMLTNIVFSLILMQRFQHVGLAIATSLAGWVNVLLLGHVLHRRSIFMPDRRLLVFLAKIVLSVLLMMAALLAMREILDPWVGENHSHKKYIAMSLLVGGGGGIYFLAFFRLRAVRISELRVWLRRERNKAAPIPE
jgi:putative peptidoglycan lipid II flippase